MKANVVHEFIWSRQLHGVGQSAKLCRDPGQSMPLLLTALARLGFKRRATVVGPIVPNAITLFRYGSNTTFQTHGPLCRTC